MKYEEALRAVGGYEHRPYQLKMLLMCCLANYVSGFLMTAFPFLTYSPTYVCRQHDNRWKTCTNICNRPSTVWSFNPNSYLSLTQEFSLICDRDWLLSTLAFLQMLGGLIGTYMCSALLDVLGRRGGILFAISLTLFSLILTSVTVTDLGLMTGLFLLGCGAGPLSIISKAYMVEYIGPQRSLYVQTATIAFALGRACNVLIALWAQNWRPLIYFILLVTIFLYFLGFSLYESPKYTLLLQHDVKSTLHILSQIRQYNDVPETSSLSLEPGESPCIAPSLFHRRYRGKVLAQCIHFFISGCGYFMIVFSQRETVGDVYMLGLGLAGTEIVSGVAAAYIADKYGRKHVYLSHFPIMGVSCALLAVLPVDWPYRQYLSLVAAYAISTIGAMPSLLAGELFPTAVRVKAGSVAALCLRIGGLTASLSLSPEASGLHPMFLVSSLSLLGLLVLPLLPETKGKEVSEEEPSKITV